MKTVLLALSFFVFPTLFAQNKNLPTPTANLVTLPAGSYVIAMDNNLQTNAGGQFNLKTYGLVVHLLNNNVKLKWSIKAGKAKDGIDFQGGAEIIQPSYAVAASRGFRAGTFVIYAADTTGVAALITSFYSTHGLSGNDRPKVYRTTVNISNVDIRFDMSGFKPKGLVLNDGGNQIIHEGYMLKCAITTQNYGIGPASSLITKCYTFASEPHHEGPTNAVVNAVRRFVEYGGNFLAQCEAVKTFENHSLGHFHSTNGITITNTSMAASATIYPNPDLPFMQTQGVSDISMGGTVRNWQFAFLSLPANNSHAHTSGGTVLSPSPIGASVAKLTGAALAGGLVFYMGTHEFTSTTNITHINGIRMYMNAFLTPVGINSNCPIGAQLPNPLPVELYSFNAYMEDDHVKLDWKTATETNTSHFVIERSADGEGFSEIGLMFTAGNSTEIRFYSFNDRAPLPEAGNLFYRIRTVDLDTRSEYSEVKLVKIQEKTSVQFALNVYPNPVQDEIRFERPAEWKDRTIVAEILGMNGSIEKKYSLSTSLPVEKLNLSGLKKGIYLLRLTCGLNVVTQKLVKL
jgi:hypothetical protein